VEVTVVVVYVKQWLWK